MLPDYVEGKLRVRWSPEQISKTLIKEYPDDQEMRVTHETIYQALYLQGRTLNQRSSHQTGSGRPFPVSHPNSKATSAIPACLYRMCEWPRGVALETTFSM